MKYDVRSFHGGESLDCDILESDVVCVEDRHYCSGRTSERKSRSKNWKSFHFRGK